MLNQNVTIHFFCTCELEQELPAQTLSATSRLAPGRSDVAASRHLQRDEALNTKNIGHTATV